MLATLRVFQGMLGSLELDRERVTRSAGDSHMLATDLADYLVAKQVPFREAHGIMRRICEHCEREGKELQALTMEEYHRFSPHFGQDVYQITAGSSVAARDNPGGTAPQQVAKELTEARRLLEAGLEIDANAL